MTKEKKIKDQSKKPFYKLWWFWVIIGAIFAGTWCLFFISNLNVRNSIIGMLGVWGSTLATIFIGIIAAKQNQQYTFLSKKQQLINDVGENITNLIHEFYKVYDLNLIYSLNRKIRTMPTITDKLERVNAQSEIMYKALAYHASLEHFKNLLNKTNFDNIKTIKLRNGIKDLDNFICNRLRHDMKTIKMEEASKQENERREFISSWVTNILQSESELSQYSQNLKLRILATKNLSELEFIEQELFENQKQILKSI